MARKNNVVFAIFRTTSQADRAVSRLTSAGFSITDISLLAPEIVTGGMLGGALGLLAGIGALTIPGVGPLIAAGPIMGALAGMGAGGGMVGALAGMGIPEYETKRYESRVKAGSLLLSVHCDTSEEIARAKSVLEQNGAEDVSSSREKAVSTASRD